MKHKLTLTTLASGMLLMAASVAQANDFYISGNWGYSNPDNLTNNGRFTSNFTTGEVTGVSPPLSLPSGTDVGWRTRLDSGDRWSLAAGWYLYDNFRLELEYSISEWDVNTHRGVEAGGLALGGIDAGVLITGTTADLGVSVADLVADGRGSVKTSTFFINGHIDFPTNTPFTPYVGLGIGTQNVDVRYRPSAVSVINDDDRVIAYQLSAGVLYALTEQLELQAGLSYVDSQRARVDSSLLPARFDIEPQSFDFRVGLKLNF